MRKIIFVYLLLLCPILSLDAQFFRGGLVAGGSFTQIDGDLIAGYTKLGGVFGFVAEIPFSQDLYNYRNLTDDEKKEIPFADRLSLSLELLYNQKGSSTALAFTNALGTEFTINMDYADIVVLAKYHDLKGGLIFGTGLSLGRLIRSRYVENGSDLSDNIFADDCSNTITTSCKPNNWDLNALVDITYMFNPVFGLNGRFAYSLLPIRKDSISL